MTEVEGADFGLVAVGVGDDGVELVVDIPVQTCSSCGPYTDDAAEDLREAVVRRHLGGLTPP